MSIEKLQRVMWRLRKNAKNKRHPLYIELERAIMYECGTHPATYRTNVRALRRLGWIVSYTKNRCRLSDIDLEES